MFPRLLIVSEAFPGRLSRDAQRRGDLGPRDAALPELVHASTEVCLDVGRRSCKAWDLVEQFVIGVILTVPQRERLSIAPILDNCNTFGDAIAADIHTVTAI